MIALDGRETALDMHFHLQRSVQARVDRMRLERALVREPMRVGVDVEVCEVKLDAEEFDTAFGALA